MWVVFEILFYQFAKGEIMQIEILIPVIIASYLIGAISFSRLVSRIAAPGVDVEDVEIPGQNGEDIQKFSAVGATVTSLKLGGKVGCLVSLLDAFKIFVPTLVLRLWIPEQPYYLFFAFFGLVGNNWPVFYRFRGGWGISAIYGGFLAVAPVGSIVTAIIGMLVGLFILRDLLSIYLLGLWLMVPWIWYFYRDSALLPYLIAYSIGVNLVLMIAFIPEFQIYLQMRREGKSMGDLMDLAPMGRGMKKMLKALKLD
jgi:glycerol-3-phosphate acyltransferase PlsY